MQAQDAIRGVVQQGGGLTEETALEMMKYDPELGFQMLQEVRRNKMVEMQMQNPQAPSGYQPNPEGGLMPIPGGPADKQAETPSPPAGFRWTPDGNLEKIPGGPADDTGKPGTALTNPMIKEIEALTGQRDAFRSLTEGFRPEFGGNIMGDWENTARRLVGDDTGQAQWWQNMQMQDNAVRHGLFGAALTATEQAAWNRTTVTPRMDPEEIQKNLQRRKEIIETATARLARVYAKGGYNKDQLGEYVTPQELGDGVEGGNPDLSAMKDDDFLAKLKAAREKARGGVQ